LIRATYEKIPGVEVVTFGCHEKGFAGDERRYANGKAGAQPSKGRQSVPAEALGDKKKRHRSTRPTGKGKRRSSRQAEEKKSTGGS
jgi:hypothetical protein